MYHWMIGVNKESQITCIEERILTTNTALLSSYNKRLLSLRDQVKAYKY